MAEIVNEMQERLLPEYEQLRKFAVCTEEQIRDCIQKRELYQLKITQSEKSIRDYADFIIFEKKIHKWIDEKEKLHGTKLISLKSSIATRIIRLYRDALRYFPQEERFWDNFLHFSKKSVPHEVLGIYEKMLMYHGDKPDVWCDAALWVYEYSSNMVKVKDLFYRGLQRHRNSELLNKTFFDILLIEAAKMRNDSDRTSEQEFGMDFVKVFYKNNTEEISNISYYLKLLERCEEEKFVCITASLQKLILDDLMEKYPTNELLWDTLANRELRGLNMIDLNNIQNTVTISTRICELDKCMEINTELDDNALSNKNNGYIHGVWRKRTLKRRITLCVKVYQKAVHSLKTTKMWSLYINSMLKLNRDMSTQPNFKRKCLANSLRDGHASGLMSVEHYCAYVKMIMPLPEGLKIAENILQNATHIKNITKIYELWILLYIMDNNEQKVLEIFRKAHKTIGIDSISLWRLTIQFYKTKYDDCSKILLQLYREACQIPNADFSELRGEFIDFCILNMSLDKTRAEYDKLCQIPPPNLLLHKKMSEIESRLAVRTEKDFERWRLCFENAVYYFGKTAVNVWLDYIKFERDYGDPKRLTILYKRARETLHTDLVDEFITEHSLMIAK